MKKKDGFILIYTIIFISVILGIIILISGQSFSEIYSARYENQSMRVLYAADSGIECVRYWHQNYHIFDTSKPQQPYSCGIGEPFLAGGNPPTSVCEATVYNFRLEGFASGACVDVQVTTVPQTALINGIPITVCSLIVVSSGKNSCTASGVNLVERTRWEDM
ncbi:MAG: hypothetical protein Q8P07_02700 [bacterium]|nr:hypothetical protein [bacterium]